MLRLLISGVLGLLTLMWTVDTAAFAVDKPIPPVQVNEQDENYSVYSIPAGAPLAIYLQSPVDTEINEPNDLIDAAVTQNFYVGQRLLVSKNTRLVGHLSRLEKPIQGRNAILGIRFHEMILENGEKLPIDAFVRTDLPDHTWGGELTPGTKPKSVTQRVVGIGAYNKTVMMGPRLMGAHIRFSPGERWIIIFAQPVSLVLPKAEG